MIDLVSMLIRHEGMKFFPYRDTVGKLTIGVGRNLDDVGITHNEALALLQHDISTATNECLHAFPWFADLTEGRQAAMVNLCFNMGLTKLGKFVRFLSAMELGNYDTAANHLLDSLWAQQVGSRRSSELVGLIRGSADA